MIIGTEGRVRKGRFPRSSLWDARSCAWRSGRVFCRSSGRGYSDRKSNAVTSGCTSRASELLLRGLIFCAGKRFRVSCLNSRYGVCGALRCLGVEPPSICTERPRSEFLSRAEAALLPRTGYCAVLSIFLILTCAVLALVSSALYANDQNQLHPRLTGGARRWCGAVVERTDHAPIYGSRVDK
jgi:hypothetical protein